MATQALEYPPQAPTLHWDLPAGPQHMGSRGGGGGLHVLQFTGGEESRWLPTLVHAVAGGFVLWLVTMAKCSSQPGPWW